MNIRLPEILAYLLQRLVAAAENAREPILLNQLVGLVDSDEVQFFMEEDACNIEEARGKVVEITNVAQESALDEVAEYARLVYDYRNGRRDSLIAYFQRSVWAIETATHVSESFGCVPRKRFKDEQAVKIKLFKGFIEQLEFVKS